MCPALDFTKLNAVKQSPCPKQFRKNQAFI